jgi:hypothetical protein
MKTKIQMIDGETYVTVTRVYFGWDVADRRGNTFVSAADLPTLQSRGLDEFVDGRSVAGAIVDRAKCAA